MIRLVAQVASILLLLAVLANGRILSDTGRARGKSMESCSAYLTAPNGTITSPNYPGDYPNNAICSWEIETTPGQRISLGFYEFHVENSPNCEKDYLEIYDGASYHLYCGREFPPITESVGTLLSVTLVIDGEIHAGHKFLATYWTYPAPDDVTGSPPFPTSFVRTTPYWHTMGTGRTTPYWHTAGSPEVNYTTPAMNNATTTPPFSCNEYMYLDDEATWGFFSSPGHEGPYPPELDCSWEFFNNFNDTFETKIAFLRLKLESTPEDLVSIWQESEVVLKYQGDYQIVIGNHGLGTPTARSRTRSTAVTMRATLPASKEASGFLFAVARGIPDVHNETFILTEIENAQKKDAPRKWSIEEMQKTEGTIFVDIDLDSKVVRSTDSKQRELASIGRFKDEVEKTASYGFLWSPNHPNDYPDSTLVVYNITAPAGRRIAVNFLRLAMEGCYDVVNLYDPYSGLNVGSCGDLQQDVFGKVFLSYGNIFQVAFRSDESYSRSGFLVAFASVEVSNSTRNSDNVP